ncbi:spermidine/putrescine transport system permease protein [Breoghania corrubedonensis]|uniref:Spermidine/putrescine transport system permease protein n=1 Tax=Breoghania corrubedonensis TaxID=665038 RepID=A0A2T5VGD4_9HYPH|nr:ABC transporter permease [Breoghania corrubedonensis]PTW62800.1 spermidine/putrescine transport system permease protein [Breoghania corrubedonensis]
MSARKSPSLMLIGYRLYIAAFFVFLAAPLVAAGTFAFNDSLFPSLPWQGFTLDWFFSATEPKLGMFHDRRLLSGLYYSFVIATCVSALSVFVGTCNAFLFVRHYFPGKNALYVVMILPLVIPGVILGIALLVLASTIANSLEQATGIELSFLRPGIVLVVLGQFSFIVTIASLVIVARLRKFDMAMEEAALNLGASRARVLATVTLPYLRPAMIAAGIVGFLVSFENFNTTLFLVGSEAPLTVIMYDRMVKVGSTPVLNAVSLVLMLGSGVLALVSILVQRDRSPS